VGSNRDELELLHGRFGLLRCVIDRSRFGPWLSAEVLLALKSNVRFRHTIEGILKMLLMRNSRCKQTCDDFFDKPEEF
jgi:hypothetical protein